MGGVRLLGLGLAGEQADPIVLCVDEAASNAVEHAYPDVVGTIDIQATRTTPDRPVRRSR